MLVHHREPPPGEDIVATYERLDRLCRHEGVAVLPTLADGARVIEAEAWSWDPDDDAAFAVLEAFVHKTWCAVTVLGGPWTEDLLRHRKLRAPHGRLCLPATVGPRHAVVLTEWQTSGIAVHDPWFDWLDQPIRVEVAWLRRAWTGECACLPP